MRKEASLDQWRTLYDTATRIKEVKPWEKFWDMDLIAVRNGKEEDTVFFSILGKGGNCQGITVYEGYEGLNTFMMLVMHEHMNLSRDYAMFNQKNLTCYWGNREELTNEQRKTIKDLGYKYRGKNQWLYFLSFEPGYYPYNLDEDEVLRMSEHLQHLEMALKYYNGLDIQVDFEQENMFLLSYGKDKKTWEFGAAPLPFTSYGFGTIIIDDDGLIADLKKVPRNKAVLEADIIIMGASVKDKKYPRPANPALPLLGDAQAEAIIGFEMCEPEEDPIAVLAEMVMGYIFQYGAPREIRVTNEIMKAGLGQICDVCNIKLRVVKRLSGLELFRQELPLYLENR